MTDGLCRVLRKLLRTYLCQLPFEAEFEELKDRHIGLAMTDGNIRLNTLNSVAEYYQEGTKQHICVGTSKYYLKADTLVMRATLGGKTITTVEISLND